MSVSRTTQLALVGISGNECAFPSCDTLVVDASGTIVGEFAHIRARSAGGPRWDASITEAERDSASNLVVLCSVHHKVVDSNPGEFPVERLEQMKAEHGGSQPLARDELLRVLGRLESERVPDDWWRRPGAPEFRLTLASSRPDTARQLSWTFEATIEQVRGDSIGDVRGRFAGDFTVADLQPLQFVGQLNRERWTLPTFDPQPRSSESQSYHHDRALGLDGPNFGIELRFWWSGAEPCALFWWARMDDFQNVQHEVRFPDD